MWPRRCLRSGIPVARQRIAMTSEAAVMSNPSSRGTPFCGPPSPMTILRRKRSFRSRTRFQLTLRGSMSTPPGKQDAEEEAEIEGEAASEQERKIEDHQRRQGPAQAGHQAEQRGAANASAWASSQGGK